MLAPTTITWPGGSTLELSRLGDRVTAVGVLLAADMFLDTKTVPTGFAPNGTISLFIGDGTAGQLAVVGTENGDASRGLTIYQEGGVSGAWLGEPVTGERSLSERLAEYVSPDAPTSPRLPADFLAECLNEAFQLVERHVGANVVPEDVRSRAILEAASELFHRRQAPNGVSQFAAPDGGAIRIARDPMNAARAILAPFLPLGFA